MNPDPQHCPKVLIISAKLSETYYTPHLIGVRNNIAGLLPVVPAGGASRRLVVGVAESAAVVRAARRRRLSLVIVRLPPLM